MCVSANYRLAPTATFPDHLIDAKKVIAWVRTHGAKYGADPSVLVVAGASSGAQLASLAALTPNDPLYQPGFESADTSVTAAVALYGLHGSRSVPMKETSTISGGRTLRNRAAAIARPNAASTLSQGVMRHVTERGGTGLSPNASIRAWDGRPPLARPPSASGHAVHRVVARRAGRVGHEPVQDPLEIEPEHLEHPAHRDVVDVRGRLHADRVLAVEQV
jgi:acetyl esterase/lipase